METELLNEPWVFQQSKTNVSKEDEKATSSIWEENFQDLSSYMDPFQGQCDFHTGESPTFKLSGTKYEGNSVLSSEEGVLKDLMSVADEEKWSAKMNNVGTTEHLNNSCHSLQSMSNVPSKCEKKDSPAESNTSNLWLKISKGSTTTVNASKQNDTDISTPFQSRNQIEEEIDLNDACPTSFDSTENQRETWDMLRTVETTGSDTFDLLSYLCDDEMHSPEGSVSTDSSSVLSKPWSPSKLSTTIPQASMKVKTEKNETVVPECTKNRTAASTVTSSSMETPVVGTERTRRAERTRISVNNKIEKPYSRARRVKAVRKRYTESDSDDRTFTSHYRESREKNNEASRKSRMNKKAKESEMAKKAIELERDNRILKMKVEELEKLVTSMRSALLKSALKKEF
ncbi:hypothetical protein K0M31_017209 [Melipona bicolor]|uniref:BZIP domain-containing protein n=1 Tax=Melipona bicolor TaxID=60889 RepID=A0AA40KS85_9HYME|nr:hypothetical protein K0M31_017209 [Melipona bicolor]